MSGTSVLRRDGRYYCQIHRRYFPYGRSSCVLCELDAGDRIDVFAAERRRKLVDYFPKGQVARLMPVKPDRF